MTKYRTHRIPYRVPGSNRRDRIDFLRMIVVVLMLVAALLAFFAYSQQGVSARSRRATEGAMSPDANYPVKHAPDGNSQCASQARARFLDMVEENGKAGTYQAHYDSNSNKCFVLVTSETNSGKETLTSITMLEAFAGDNFAYYAARGSENLVSGVAPTVCEVTSLQTGKTQFCSSHEEFQSLLKPYMQ